MQEILHRIVLLGYSRDVAVNPVAGDEGDLLRVLQEFLNADIRLSRHIGQQVRIFTFKHLLGGDIGVHEQNHNRNQNGQQKKNNILFFTLTKRRLGFKVKGTFKS